MANQKIAIEIDKHKTISLHMQDNLKLFVSKFICNYSKLLSRKCWRRRDKFFQLYDKGYEKLKKQLNVIKLIKTVKHNKTLMRNSIMSQSIKNTLAHCEDNIINLSESSSDSV